ncbi:MULTISPECIES: hypothetical protein [unclassified Yoonia]|uniref:hypothetical protein n=1 Tax=unclassified Yoonia TaxID=2629118 RepID=UPI002AFE1B3B|nr:MULTISPECIES: hypothetical protein [unclassified Yoonia]
MNKQKLITLAEMYAEHTGLKLSTVSTYATNDGKFFASLKLQSDCTLRRAQRVLSWFSRNWPNDLEWPSEIDRPDANEAAA